MANETCCVVSPSLINSVKTDLNKLNKTGFNLGMDEWISDLPDLDADVENEAPLFLMVARILCSLLTASLNQWAPLNDLKLRRG